MEGNGSASRVQFGTVTLIPDERLLLKDGHPVSLTPKAFDLLVVLTANPGRLLTKEQLMQAVWPDATVEESNLAYHVFAIRKALGESADSDRCIETVPKRGYRFVAPVKVEAEGRALHAGARHTATFPGRRRTGITLRVWLGLAGGLAVVALMLPGLSPFGNRSVPTEPVRFQEPVSGRLAETGMFSISPDGRRLVYAAEGADGVLRLWARAMNTLQPVPIPGTEVFAIIRPWCGLPIAASSPSILATHSRKRVWMAAPRSQSARCPGPPWAAAGTVRVKSSSETRLVAWFGARPQVASPPL